MQGYKPVYDLDREESLSDEADPSYLADRKRYGLTRSQIALLVSTIACIALLASIAKNSAPSAVLDAPLRFTRDGTFQISVFEDLHFGESMNARDMDTAELTSLTRCRRMGAMGPSAGFLERESDESGS